MAEIIKQLQRTKQERRESSQKGMHDLSLETSFAHYLDKRTGGMDKLADFIEPRTEFT
jgi:hypothetical protein